MRADARGWAALLILPCALLLGCHKPPKAPAPAVNEITYGSCSRCPPDAPAPSPVLVGLERSICFGTCPAYGVLVHEDGLVEYLGRGGVFVAGYCSARLSASRLKKLRTLVRTHPLGSLNEGVDVIDSAVTRVFHPASDGTLEEALTSEMEVASSPPLPLLLLARHLDELAGDVRWVGSVAERERNARPLVHHTCPGRLLPAWSRWFPIMDPPPPPPPPSAGPDFLFHSP